MLRATAYILSLLSLGGGSVTWAQGLHQNNLPASTPVDVSKVSGSIPGISRGAIAQPGQGQQPQIGQQGEQGRLSQMLGQIQAMSASSSGGGAGGGAGGGSGGAGRGAGKGDGPIEIGKKAGEFFDQATKANSEAFKQLNQSFQQSQDKNKPNPDNAKITEGLAEDQLKLAEANAKAPPVGSDIVADLIKGINERSDTKVKTEAQYGLQMAPPGPGSFAAASPKMTIADRLQGLQLAAVPQARSTFTAGDKLVGGASEAIPNLPGSRIGANNIGHAFMASSGGPSSIPERIERPSSARGASDDSSDSRSFGGGAGGGNFVGNNFNVIRPSNSGGGGSSGSSVFDHVGETSSQDRAPASVKANTVSAIDGMIGGGSSEASPSNVKRRSSRGAREQLLKRSYPAKR